MLDGADIYFFFSSIIRHTRWPRDWSSDVCSSDLGIAEGQRGWKRHPDGRLSALGISPVIGFVWVRSSGWDGSAAAKSACVYGCIGRVHNASLSPVSTILPRYITAMRWLM